MTSSAPESGQIELKIPIRFFTAQGMNSGQCVSVSESGMLVAFIEPPDVWLIGEISADIGEQHVSLKARVARVEGHAIGLSYSIRTEHDHLYVKMLLDFAKAQNMPPPPDSKPAAI